MKQTKTLLLTAILTLTAFGAIIYTSCSKDKCSGVNCQNGGACSGGTCSCPSGYSGQFCELSSIVIQNNAPTAVNVTVNSTQTSIPAGNSATFVGTAGTNATVTASTAGAYGLVYNWQPFTDQFPTNGYPLTETLDISADYFYLQVTNNDPFTINGMSVNVGTSAQSSESVNVPSGASYGMGYYLAYASTKILFNFTDGGTYPTGTLSIPNNLDAVYTVYVP